MQAWTRLEALAKADGIGIGWLVTEIGVVGGKRRPQGAALPEPVLRLASRFETRDLDVGPFATAAVAVSRGMALNNTVRVREMPVELEALRALLSGRVAFF